MNVIERAASLALDLLPTDEARQVLLPPVRALREIAVSAAAAARHWELILEGAHNQPEPAGQGQRPTAPHMREHDSSVPEQTAAEPTAEVWDDIGGAPVRSTDDALSDAELEVAEPEATVVDVRDLPIEEWPQLSFADAQARLHDLDAQDIQSLIDYETEHGHRVRYTLILKERLSALASASDK
jgi:hypothetical protein